tara:strand:- start:213 stop:527 length:315 start_codon:yes stop_codon:yes gene_type:complete
MHVARKNKALEKRLKQDRKAKDWAQELLGHCAENECTLESGLGNLRDFHDALGGELGQEVLNTAYAIDAQRDEPDGDDRKAQPSYHNKPGQRRSSLNPYKKTTH